MIRNNASTAETEDAFYVTIKINWQINIFIYN